MSLMFQEEILKLRFKNESRSSTPFTYDSDCSGSGFDPLEPISVEDIVEWEWPPESGEFFLLQEDIKELLGSRNFHRRYPDIHRHNIGAEERQSLLDQGILKDYNSAFSFVGVYTEDVLDILREDFPAKYKALIAVFRSREQLKKIKSVIKESDAAENYQNVNICHNLRETLVDDAQNFNKRLRLSRGARGRTFTCKNTEIRQIPQNERYMAPRHYTRRGRYPVAVLPGQYTDSVPEYTSEKLFTLPLNTVLLHDKELPQKPPKTSTTVPKNITVNCNYCSKEVNKSDDIIRCNKCKKYYHTKCIDIRSSMLKTITRYSWDCPNCKTCSVCDAPDGEESLMFCDICDRGYHNYCINISNIPRGRWECRLCVKCSCCESTYSGDGPWRFQHDDSMKFLQTMCYPCTVYFDKGWFCPACLKSFDYDAVDDPMVCCDFCDRWVHTGCDNIDDEHYALLSESGSQEYKCILCRGEKEEIYDKYHKKYSNKEGGGLSESSSKADSSANDSNKENHVKSDDEMHRNIQD